MPQEGRSGKSQGSDEFQPARRLAASVAPAPPRRLTSELQRARLLPGLMMPGQRWQLWLSTNLSDYTPCDAATPDRSPGSGRGTTVRKRADHLVQIVADHQAVVFEVVQPDIVIAIGLGEQRI